MFSNTHRASLIALIASAAAVSATPSLSVKIDGAAEFTDVENMKVKTTIINTGDEILKILNDPRSALSKFPANTFAITDANGASPSFQGIRAKYVPSVAIATGKDAITTLAPGQSVEVEHDLSEAYSFSKSGESTYSLEANNRFFIVDSNNKAVPLYANAETHRAKLTGRLTRTRAAEIKRATFNGCTAEQQKDLNTAASSAQAYAAESLKYLDSHTSATTRYTTWFGAYTDARHGTVQGHYSKISGNDFSSFKYDCTCTKADTYAFVYPNTFGTIFLCGAFWKAPNTGTDSRAGTLIHEASHFTKNGGTTDIVYGQANAKNLALTRPDEAITNADSHEYFTENTPALA